MTPLASGDPRQVGRYWLLARIGHGGMGRVFLGSGPDGRLVAVKRIHEHIADDPEFRQRFRREVAASGRVSGAFTAPVIDHDVNASIPWSASAYVPGVPLSEVLRHMGRLPEDAVLRLAAGLASALTELGRVNLVHRDLKPSNILLTDEGLRLIDFGIARAVDSTRLTGTHQVIGSLEFMSPEQAEGQAVTVASDMFSLGSVLTTAATGESPFSGASAAQLLYKIVYKEPALAGVPPLTRVLVERCLHKDPARRFTPSSLLDAIGRVPPKARPWPGGVHSLISARQDDLHRLIRRNPPTVSTIDEPLRIEGAVDRARHGALASALDAHWWDRVCAESPAGSPERRIVLQRFASSLKAHQQATSTGATLIDHQNSLGESTTRLDVDATLLLDPGIESPRVVWAPTWVRALATRYGVELASIVGTGTDGAITSRDVLDAAVRADGSRHDLSPSTSSLAFRLGAAIPVVRRRRAPESPGRPEPDEEEEPILGTDADGLLIVALVVLLAVGFVVGFVMFFGA